MDVSRLPKREQVFVSSTYDDLREERLLVTQRLLELRCIPAGMELFPAASDDKWDLIRRVIAESDYYVLLLGGRYGSISTDSGISYTEREFEFAVESSKPVLAFLRTDEGLSASRVDYEPSLRDQLERFRTRVKATFPVKFWSSPDELASQVMAAIMEARETHPAEGWVKASEIRAQLGLAPELVDALNFAGIVEISPGVGGRRNHLVFERIPGAKRIDVFANSAYHFLSLNEASIIEALRNPDCRIRICVTEPDHNVMLEATMYHSDLQQTIPISEGLCPGKDLPSEITSAIRYLEQVIYPEARRSCIRSDINGPGRVEVYRYSGMPTCGLIFVDEELARLVPYIPFAGSNQSPSLVCKRGEGGHLFDYLWGKFLDVISCVGPPSVVLSRND
jgi:hypothetical protein